MGVAGTVRLVQAHRFQQLIDLLVPACLAVCQAVNINSFGNNVFYFHSRVQRCIRVLINHLYCLPECFQFGLPFDAADVFAIKDNPAGSRLIQADNAAAGRRLAATRFAHQSESFSFINVEADVIHSSDFIRSADIEILLQMCDFKYFSRCFSIFHRFGSFASSCYCLSKNCFCRL